MSDDTNWGGEAGRAASVNLGPFSTADFAAAGVTPERAATFIGPMNAAAVEFGISTPLRAIHFLTQVTIESWNFRYLQEVWGPTSAQSGYENRHDLGNDLPGAGGPGNGRRWSGHGLIEVTGYANHLAMSSHFGIPMDSIVAFLVSPAGAARSAGYFWLTHGCNSFADADDLSGLRRRINGGTNGLADCMIVLLALKKLRGM
jgi:putative chitinase